MKRPILLIGGGTGGHVFPLVAVAQALRKLEPSQEIVFVGTAKGMEVRILRDLNEQLELLEVLPIKGGGLAGAARGVLRAGMSLPDAFHLVRRYRPSVVLSIGGYAAGPVSVATRAMRIPLALLEPNRVLGLAHQLIAPAATRLYVAFPETTGAFSRKSVLCTGVPLRTGFEPSAYTPASNTLRLLVIGGSQGAITLNKNVPVAIASLRRILGTRVEVTHQSGRGRLDEVLDVYRASQALDDTTVVPFIDDVPAAISVADVVIQRAGASAIAETCAIGRASVLIPYPFAAGNHQLHNAQALERMGAAVCVPSPEASPERLCELLLALARDVGWRQALARRAQAHGKPDASNSIAKDLLKIAEAT